MASSTARVFRVVFVPSAARIVSLFPAGAGALCRPFVNRCAISANTARRLNVRRSFLSVVQLIDDGTQRVVFEPNDESFLGRCDRVPHFIRGGACEFPFTDR